MRLSMHLPVFPWTFPSLNTKHSNTRTPNTYHSPHHQAPLPHHEQTPPPPNTHHHKETRPCSKVQKPNALINLFCSQTGQVIGCLHVFINARPSNPCWLHAKQAWLKWFDACKFVDISQVFDIFSINCSYDSLENSFKFLGGLRKIVCALVLTKALRSWSQTHCLQVLLLAGNWSLAKQMLFMIYDISTTDLHRTMMIMTMVLLTSWSPQCDLMARISNQWSENQV